MSYYEESMIDLIDKNTKTEDLLEVFCRGVGFTQAEINARMNRGDQDPKLELYKRAIENGWQAFMETLNNG